MRQSVWRGLVCCALALLMACSSGMYREAASAAAPGAVPTPPPSDPSGGELARSEADADTRIASVEQSNDGLATSGGGVPQVSFPSAPSPLDAAVPARPVPSSGSGSSQGVSVPLKSPSGSLEVAVARRPILIYTAQVTMAVFEVNQALLRIEDLGRELGGFLARRDDTSITIRVPVASFDAAIQRIEKTGDVLHRNVTAQDVTEEFRDLEVRIRNARAVRDRLEQLLAKATKVDESVLVERELERVAGEIERLEGKIKFLRDRAAFSTITVAFQPKQKEDISQSPFRLPVPWLSQLGLGRLLNL